MDCHKRRWPALAVALGLGWTAGCQHDGSNGAPVVQVNHPVVAIEQEKSGPKRPPRPDTCVAAGDFYAHEAATRDNGSAVQEQMRESARKAYQQALQIEPRYLPAYHSLAQLYTAMDDHEHAIATYQKASSYHPN